MLKSSLVSVALTVFALHGALAQTAKGFRAPASGGSSRGTPAKEAPGIRVNTTAREAAERQNQAPAVVGERMVPGLVTADGSVFGDFGFGLEQVRRACTVNPGVQQQISAGIVPAQTGLPPSNQSNAVPQQRPALRQPSQAAAHACFSRDSNGRFFIIR